jgi:hypothetical protein
MACLGQSGSGLDRRRIGTGGMADFIFLMHGDAPSAPTGEMWESYLANLRRLGIFDGGSAIGDGAAFRKDGASGRETDHLTGYIRIRADNVDEARRHLVGNPVFENGGTVEIRELPKG